MKSRVLTFVALASVLPLWWAGGFVAMQLGLEDLDLLGNLLFVFAGLTLLERILKASASNRRPTTR